jgi:hypothetical protein
MTSQCPETITEAWRLELAQAERQYRENQTVETRAEYLRVLAIFAALVVHGEMPAEGADPAVKDQVTKAGQANRVSIGQ